MDVVICIPVYKQKLDVFEQVSLKQVNKILKRYKKVYVGPKSLTIESGNGYIDIEIERFDDKYFESASGYSELCVSKELYERFDQYDYMLIYQLDAFVFSDQLMEWCNKGYDYVGAPGLYGIFDEMCAWVGNGGFSLRKISSMIYVLNEYKDILDTHPFHKLFHSNEDVFWAYCGQSKKIKFKVPEVLEAQKFSAQNAINNFLFEEFPFGTHYYNTANYDIWQPIISSYGYELPSSEYVKFENTFGDEPKRWYAFYSAYQKVSSGIFNSELSANSYCLVGAGRVGKECLHLLDLMGCKVSYVFDNNLQALYGIDELEKYTVRKQEEMRFLLKDETLLIGIRVIDEETSENIEWAKNKGNKIINHKQFFEMLRK